MDQQLQNSTSPTSLPPLDIDDTAKPTPKTEHPHSAVMFPDSERLPKLGENRPRSAKIKQRKKTPFLNDLKSAIDSFVEFENAHKGQTFTNLADFEKATAAFSKNKNANATSNQQPSPSANTPAVATVNSATKQ